MNFLLDTHAVIWHLKGSSELSIAAKTAILDPQNKTFISTAVLWEIGIKVNIGKIEFAFPFVDFKTLFKINNFEELSIRFEHIEKYVNLPLHHRDPFDRIQIAQALVENFIIVSCDSNFHLYDLPILW